MGILDERPFQVACKRKYRDNNPEGKAAVDTEAILVSF
jgi:hypothetical protein